MLRGFRALIPGPPGGTPPPRPPNPESKQDRRLKPRSTNEALRNPSGRTSHDNVCGSKKSVPMRRETRLLVGWDRQFESRLLQQRGTANRRLRWFILQHRDESLVETELEPIPGAVAGPVRAGAALGDDALKALGANGFDEFGHRYIEALGIPNRLAQFWHESVAERVAAF
jgi:hypothetical protein